MVVVIAATAHDCPEARWAVPVGQTDGVCAVSVKLPSAEAKAGVPENAASIRWIPAVMAVTVQFAMPVTVLTGRAVQVGIAVVSSVKVTVPPSGVGVTVAV